MMLERLADSNAGAVMEILAVAPTPGIPTPTLRLPDRIPGCAGSAWTTILQVPPTGTEARQPFELTANSEAFVPPRNGLIDPREMPPVFRTTKVLLGGTEFTGAGKVKLVGVMVIAGAATAIPVKVATAAPPGVPETVSVPDLAPTVPFSGAANFADDKHVCLGFRGAPHVLLKVKKGL